MKRTHKNNTHWVMPVEIQFGAISASWSSSSVVYMGERDLFPNISTHPQRMAAPLRDPEHIRRTFLRSSLADEESALQFLSEVGVWAAIEDKSDLQVTGDHLMLGDNVVGRKGMLLMGAFGHRWFDGRALSTTATELRQEQGFWRGLLRDRKKLRAAFSIPPGREATPAKRDLYALHSHYNNALHVHMEWRGRHARAVMQPLTGRELMIALAWRDLISEARCKVCANCHVEYTFGGYKYCTFNCEHARNTRLCRARKAAKQAALVGESMTDIRTRT